MATLRELAIQIAFDAEVQKMDRVDEKLEDITDEANRGEKAVGGLGSMMKKAFIGLGIATAVGLIGRKTVGTIAQFQQLRAQLETIEGSAEKAGKQFDMLTDFASTTPFQLENVVSAFTRMRAVGLNPTTEDLTAMGDTAAGMGKDIVDFADAVVGATTGEADRLKQFGIIMKTEGEKVKINFKGQTTEIKKDAETISQTLFNLGRENFAGGMARQADTIGGSFSNLQDNINKFFATIGEAGVGGEIVKIIKMFTESAQGADSLAMVLGRTLAQALAVIRGATQLFLDNLTGISVILGILTTGMIAYGTGLVATKFNTLAVALATGKWSVALSAVNLQMIALGAKILLIVGVLALMAFGIEDLIGFLQGKDSVLGDFFEEMGLKGDEAFQALFVGAMAVLAVLGVLAATVGLPFIVVIGLIGLLIGLLVYLYDVGIENIIQAFTNMFFAIEDAFNRAKPLVMDWLNETGEAIGKWAAEVWFPIEEAFRDMLSDLEKFLLSFISMVGDQISGFIDTAMSPLDFAANLIGGGASNPGIDARRRASEVSNTKSVNVEASIPITLQNPGGTAADNDAVAQDMERKVKGVFKRILGGVAGDLEGGVE